MGVPGDDQPVPERGRLRSRVGRVHHGEAEVIVLAPGSDTEVVAPDVGVVETEQLGLEPEERDRAARVREVLPSVRDERTDQIRRAAGYRLAAEDAPNGSRPGS